MLDAARDLFEELGYEDATLRLIAKRAGVSVGSVFTTFSGKNEILSEVMDEQIEALLAELQAAAAGLKDTLQRLCAMMAAGYGFETRRLRLFLAYMGASYDVSAGEDVLRARRNLKIKAIVREVLMEGVARGEVRADADLEAFMELLLAAYMWNYRRAIHESADPPALIMAMGTQIRLMFDGVAPQPAS